MTDIRKSEIYEIVSVLGSELVAEMMADTPPNFPAYWMKGLASPNDHQKEALMDIRDVMAQLPAYMSAEDRRAWFRRENDHVMSTPAQAIRHGMPQLAMNAATLVAM